MGTLLPYYLDVACLLSAKAATQQIMSLYFRFGSVPSD